MLYSPYQEHSKGEEMEKTYNSREIVQMAIQAKARGVELYMALARSSENYHVSNLFAELAKEAQRYKIQLEKWLEELDEHKREEAYPGEKAMYLKALVDANTFNCDKAKKQALEKTISEEDALRAGITFKKDFMLFLHELKHHAGSEGTGTIDSIIEEEIAHLKDMFHLEEKMKKG